MVHKAEDEILAASHRFMACELKDHAYNQSMECVVRPVDPMTNDNVAACQVLPSFLPFFFSF